MSALVSAGCSFLLNPDEHQCQQDADCVARGLGAARCLDHLCTADKSAASSGTDDRSGTSALAVSANEGPDATRVADASVIEAERDAPATDGRRAGAETGEGAAGQAADVDVADAGSKDLGSVVRDMRTAMAGASADKGTAAPAGPCPGAGCPECMSDADCERAGVTRGVCSEFVCYTPPTECLADPECLALGPEYDGGRCVAMQCLPNPRIRCDPVPVVPDSTTKEVRVPIIDAVSRSRRSGVKVTACRTLDITCADPVTEATSSSDGIVTMTLPGNFDGYLQQTEAANYLPAMYFLPSINPPTDLYNDFPLLGSGVVADALAMSLGASLDADRGHMMLVAQDCYFMPLGGVTFSSPQQDDKTVQFYVQDQLPSTSATATTEVGQGGYLNFPPGTTTLKLEQADKGLELVTVSVLVRAGFVTVAFMPPRTR